MGLISQATKAAYDAVVTAYAAHAANTSNPHSTTAAQVGAVPVARTLTIAGETFDLSANRTFVGGSGSAFTAITVPGNLTVSTSTHAGKMLHITANAVLTLPSSPPDDFYFDLKSTGAFTITLDVSGSTQVDNGGAATDVVINDPKAGHRVYARGGNYFLWPPIQDVVLA